MIETFPCVGIPVGNRLTRGSAGKIHVTAIGDGVGNLPSVSDGQNVVTLDGTKAAGFFRLKKP